MGVVRPYKGCNCSSWATIQMVKDQLISAQNNAGIDGRFRNVDSKIIFTGLKILRQT
uniref:Uncharacterized protein n=1 Tax=Anguilla anguilla TaxID=7936 RepID=A0A0E9SQD0_ANGAN